MQAVKCPHCGTRVLSKPDGSCPSCQRNTNESPTPEDVAAQARSRAELAGRERSASFAKQAAKGSWVAPLLTLAVTFFSSSQIKGPSAKDVAIVVLAAVWILLLAGVVMAFIALANIKKTGTQGILIPSIVGLLLSSCLIYFQFAAYWALQK